MMCEIDESKELRVEEMRLLSNYLHKRFWIRKVQNNNRTPLLNKGGFLKYNYGVLVYYITIIYYTINHSLYNYRQYRSVKPLII